MAKRPTSSAPPAAPALLVTPRDEARGQLLSRHEIGLTLRNRPISSPEALEQARTEYQRWTAYNEELIRRMFTTEEYAISYRSSGGLRVIGLSERTLSRKIDDWREIVDSKLNKIMSLAERLDLIGEVVGVVAAAPKVSQLAAPKVENGRVFLVHGQDEEAKAIVARFIEHCGLRPIILHEQADQGRTIIEKFEQEADVGFAVVLLTPDDVGGLKDAGGTITSKTLKPRARQNVVLELGYFIGRLGRSRVCALRKGDVELPSDISGVVYTPLGADEGWKVKLAKELRVAGYDVDLNRALG